MGSIKNKCLLKASGKTLLEWTLHTLNQLQFPNIIIVTRSTDTGIENLIKAKNIKNVSVVSDPFFLGAGHALFVGTINIQNPLKYRYVLVLYGDDSFLYQPTTLAHFLSDFTKNSSPLEIMTTKREVVGSIGGLKRDASDKPNGFYTRAELDSLKLTKAEIVCGVFLYNFDWLKKHFHKIVKNDTSGEFMLTSLIQVAHDEQTPAYVFELQNQEEWCGVNTIADLRLARRLKRKQLQK